MAKSNVPVIRIPNLPKVPPDNDKVWENKFFVKSENSDNLYVVSQHIKKRHWGCGCAGYRIHRKCKHLKAIGLPCHEVPYEAKLSQ